MKEYRTLKSGDIVKFSDDSRSMWRGDLFLVVERYDAYYGDDLVGMVRALNSLDGTIYTFSESSLEFVGEKT